MATRNDKVVHICFNVVAYGSIIQSLLLIYGAVLWWGSSPSRAETATALAVGMVSIATASLAITIGCAMRPVNRGIALIYAVCLVAASVLVVMFMLDVSSLQTDTCKLSFDGGTPMSTSLACPKLIQHVQTVKLARARCESTVANGQCYWTDRCTVRSRDQCDTESILGSCHYAADAEGCQILDNFNDVAIKDAYGVCAASGQCRFASNVKVAGLVFLCLAGISLVAMGYILNDSRYPAKIKMFPRRGQRSEALSSVVIVLLAGVRYAHRSAGQHSLLMNNNHVSAVCVHSASGPSRCS